MIVFLKVLSIVVSKVIVGDNGGEADSAANQIVTHDCLESSLTRFKVASSNIGLLFLGVIDNSRVESVLRRPVQVKNLLLNCCDAVKNGAGKSNVSRNSIVELSDVLDLREKEHFGVGRPENDHLVDLLLHVLDIFTDFLDALLVSALVNVVDSIGLVGSNELLVQNGWQRDNSLKVLLEFIDQSRLENVCSFG